MNIKELKELIKNIPDEMEVFISSKHNTNPLNTEDTGKFAYMHADAMLAERSKNDKH